MKKLTGVWDQNKPVNVLNKEWKGKMYEIMAKCFKKRHKATKKHHLAVRACKELRKKNIELKQILNEANKNEDNFREGVLKMRIKDMNKALLRTENESKNIRMKVNIEKLNRTPVQSSIRVLSSNNDFWMCSCILSSWENGIPLNKLFTLGGRLFNPPNGEQVLKRVESHRCEGFLLVILVRFFRFLKDFELSMLAI